MFNMIMTNSLYSTCYYC